MAGAHTDFYFILLGAFAVFVAVSIGVALVLWIMLPFSVFGTKGLIRKAIEEQEKTNELLRALLEAAVASGVAGDADRDTAGGSTRDSNREGGAGDEDRQ
jgi:hypothetical protein